MTTEAVYIHIYNKLNNLLCINNKITYIKWYSKTGSFTAFEVVKKREKNWGS